MPRYFFHLYDDVVSRDEEGLELPDQASAARKAIASARHMACQEVLEGHLNLNHRIEIENEAGEVVLTVRFEDAVKMED